ncbi:MAG: hypothetical protein AAF849_03865 [Bacteroidota bacterium]
MNINFLFSLYSLWFKNCTDYRKNQGSEYDVFSQEQVDGNYH